MRRSAWLLPFVLLPVLACPAEDDDATTGGSAPTSDGTEVGEEDTTPSSGDPRAECLDEAPRDTTDGATTTIMDRWGAACSSDADCVALLGDGAVCDDKAVIYELPGRYCTKPCSLPDAETTVVLDAADCDPAGGIACVGLIPIYSRCAQPCTDDTQCNRDGYICRQMPQISRPEDPSFCLMPDCCQGECSSSP